MIKGLFLDTATQIARHWHADSEKEEIKQQLEGLNLYCSEYVKCQYKATLLNSLILLYNLLSKFHDLPTALRETSRYENSKIAGGKLSPAVQKRIRDVGLWLLQQSFEEQKSYLEDLIEQAWETFFLEGIKEPLINQTNCLYANSQPNKGIRGYEPIKITCTKATPHDCGINEFWKNHRVQLEILANMNISSIQSDLKDEKELTTIKSEASLIASGQPPHGERCTVTLSDAIICIESTHCPETSAVHSINKKHFRPLCELLGIESKP